MRVGWGSQGRKRGPYLNESDTSLPLDFCVRGANGEEVLLSESAILGDTFYAPSPPNS
jgi:hypothetical protein